MVGGDQALSARITYLRGTRRFAGLAGVERDSGDGQVAGGYSRRSPFLVLSRRLCEMGGRQQKLADGVFLSADATRAQSVDGGRPADRRSVEF